MRRPRRRGECWYLGEVKRPISGILFIQNYYCCDFPAHLLGHPRFPYCLDIYVP